MLDSEQIIQIGGLLAIAAIIFAESGLLIGILFPGDTLLLTAGFFAGAGKLSLSWLIIVSAIAAIIGDNVGYHIGYRVGPKIFRRKDGLLFRQEYIEKTREYFEKYGGATISLARFIAYVRTFAPMVAGVGRMNWAKFAFYNVIGAVTWVASVSLVGYFVGYSFPGIDKYFITFIVVAAWVITFVVLWQVLKYPDNRRRLKQGLLEEYRHFFKKK